MLKQLHPTAATRRALHVSRKEKLLIFVFLRRSYLLILVGGEDHLLYFRFSTRYWNHIFLLYLQTVGELEGWDIKSAKGQRHFYSKVRTWGFLAVANTCLMTVPQRKLFLLTIQPLFPQGIASIHLFLGRVIRPFRALCCHGYTASGTCTAKPG